MKIDKENFISIIERLRNYNDLQKKIDKIFEDLIDNKENDFCNSGSICIGHETVVVYLLELIFETDLISWWLYEKDYGTKFKLGDFIDDNISIDISTPDKLYDYLIKIKGERNEKI